MSAPRDIIIDALITRGTHAESVLEALAEAGFVLVQRPVDGSDRVIRWETTTCPECYGWGVVPVDVAVPAEPTPESET